MSVPAPYRSSSPALAQAETPAGRARAILVIDDEAPIRQAVSESLREIAEQVVEAGSGAEALAAVTSALPDLVVLDLGLPDQEGIVVCETLRRCGTMPIIVLSARHAEQEKIALLNAGADDYVTKPFSLGELVARARAQLRRASLRAARAEGQILDLGPLRMDVARRVLTRRGEPVHLTPIEWELLRTLAEHAGRTLTHQQLFDAVWQRDFGNPQQYLRVYMTTLRRKIEDDPSDPRFIITDPGVGYRFELAH